jgi:sterol desaturase/sphingolipid hydroxylase (fatty acid hydroxylase superfamily)
LKTAEFRFGEGRISGSLSILFGALALGGVLCIRFPGLLTVPDAREFYAAHLGLLRGLLHGLLVASFALGALSIVLWHGRRLGLAGLALALVAALAGGSQARLGSSNGNPYAAGLDYFLLELLALGVVFVPLERLWPRKPEQRMLRADFRLDLVHFFCAHVLVQALTFASFLPARAFFGWASGASWQAAVAAQPFALQVVEIVLVVDFFSYWTHRAFHRFPALWRFHAVHHSPREMDWLAGSRMHLVDALANRVAGYLPIYVLGFAPGPFLVYVSWLSFQAVFIHANVRWRFPALRWLVATPEFHHWHHARDLEGRDKNFAVLCPVWDLLFGTAHQPAHWPRELGIDETLPATYIGQQLHPFRRTHP